MSYYVYILECRDKTFYTGVTNSLVRRLQEHKSGLDPNSYVFNRRPIKLVFYATFSEIETAITFEKQLKGWSRAKKMALIENRFKDLPNLAKKSF